MAGSGQVFDPTDVDASPNTTGYYNEFEAHLNTLLSGDQEEIDNLDSLMNDKYRNICIRPRSMDLIKETLVDDNGNPYYEQLPSYVKIEISLNGEDTPPAYMPQRIAAAEYFGTVSNWYRESLKESGLWDHFITNLIRVDIEGLTSSILTHYGNTGTGPGEGSIKSIALETLTERNNSEGTVDKTRRLHSAGMLKDMPGSPTTRQWTMDPWNNWVRPWTAITNPNFSTWDIQPVYNTEQIQHIRPAAVDESPALGVYLIDSAYFRVIDTSIPNNLFGFEELPDSDATDLHNKLGELKNNYLLNGANLRKNLMRTIKEYQEGENCYSETLMFKIEKRVVPPNLLSIPLQDLDNHTPVQTIYIPNDDNLNNIEYIDSQVIYGTRYQYDIKTIKYVVGSQVSYSEVRAPGETGYGKAVGNALGFYKETEQGFRAAKYAARR